MKTRDRPARRGVALLLVLAALLIVVTVAAGLARVASISKVTTRSRSEVQLADQLMYAAEAPILDWLATDSATVVLPDDIQAPVVIVLHDEWLVGDRHFELRITAWDQLGMVPVERAAKGSVLRNALPENVRRAIDEEVNVLRGHSAPGLDLFVSAERDIPAFPDARSIEPARFTTDDSTHGQRVGDGDIDDTAAPDIVRGIGAYIATHNAELTRLNINTAPMPLVEAALRAAGRGGSDVIKANRRERRMSNAPPGSSTRGQADEQRVLVVSTSDIWAFRIDVDVNRTRRSWWCVYERSAAPGGRGTPWRCVQRLLIPESSP